MRRWGAVVLAGAVALVVLGGCRVDTTVSVTMGERGSGTVRVEVQLDHDAASRVPHLDRLLKVDDLRKAGWNVTGPTATAGGGQVLTASKPFGTPAQAEQILASLNGPAGPLREVRVERSTGFVSTSYRVRATIDLHGGLDALGDPGLVKALGGTSVVDAAKGLAQPGDPPAAQELGFRFAVALPGQSRAWDVPLGSPAQPVTASVSRTDAWRLALVALAVVAALAAAALFFAPKVRRRRGARPPRSS